MLCLVSDFNGGGVLGKIVLFYIFVYVLLNLSHVGVSNTHAPIQCVKRKTPRCLSRGVYPAMKDCFAPKWLFRKTRSLLWHFSNGCFRFAFQREHIRI